MVASTIEIITMFTTLSDEPIVAYCDLESCIVIKDPVFKFQNALPNTALSDNF